MRRKETEEQKEMRRFEKETTIAYVITIPDAFHLARGFKKVSTKMAIAHNETGASVSGVHMHRRGKVGRDLYKQFRYGLLIRLREKVNELRGNANE